MKRKEINLGLAALLLLIGFIACSYLAFLVLHYSHGGDVEILFELFIFLLSCAVTSFFLGIILSAFYIIKSDNKKNKITISFWKLILSIVISICVFCFLIIGVGWYLIVTSISF